MNTYYEYPCGCIIDTEKAKYTSTSKNYVRVFGYFCPDHGGKVTHKIEYCSKCSRKIRREMPANNKVDLCGRCKEKDSKRIVFKNPVRVFSVAEAIIKGVPYIPYAILFKAHTNDMSSMPKHGSIH